MIQRHYLISGRVQGVGYRRFAERAGQSLGLKGAVRNLADGRVEALAEGSRESLESFETALSRGPLLSSVREIEKKDVATAADAKIARLLKTSFAVAEDGQETWL